MSVPAMTHAGTCERCETRIFRGRYTDADRLAGVLPPEVPIAHFTPAGDVLRVEWICRACYEARGR